MRMMINENNDLSSSFRDASGLMVPVRLDLAIILLHTKVEDLASNGVTQQHQNGPVALSGARTYTL